MENQLFAYITINNIKYLLKRLSFEDFNQFIKFRDYETGIPQIFTDDGRYWPYLCKAIVENTKFHFEIFSIEDKNKSMFEVEE